MYLIFLCCIVVSFQCLICKADRSFKELALEACPDAFAKFTEADWIDRAGHQTGRVAPKACADVAACTQQEVKTAVGRTFFSWSAGCLGQLKYSANRPLKSGMKNCFGKEVACWPQFTSVAQLAADQLCQPKHEFDVNDPLTIKIRKRWWSNTFPEFKPAIFETLDVTAGRNQILQNAEK